NQWGELGDGTKTDALVPVDVAGLQSVAAIGTGNNFSCAVMTSGRVKCWGDNRQGQLGNGTSKEALVPEEAKGISSAIKVDGGSLHACALLRQGTVNCWGFNQTGQLGYSTRDDTTRPVHEQGIFVPDEVIGVRSAHEVTTGLMHSCALEDRSTVKCWGGNTNGGYFTAMVGTSTTVPIDVKVVP
ncbi:MAG: RCC1 domain-containing protein, partial [Nitrospiraceae bacterium]